MRKIRIVKHKDRISYREWGSGRKKVNLLLTPCARKVQH